MASTYPSKLIPACSLAKSSLSVFLREAASTIKCLFSNGSLCRPPESYVPSRSWCSFSEMVCVWLTHSVSRHLGSGTFYWSVAHRLQKVSEASFRHQNVYSQGEQRLASRMHITFLYLVTHGYDIDLMRFEALHDTHAARKMMCLSLDCTRVKQLLLLLVRWVQQTNISFDSYCFLLIGLHFVKTSSYIHACAFKELTLTFTQHSGGLVSDSSRYHNLIERLTSLQVQRSSTGCVVHHLKHYMLASTVSHLLVASSILHSLNTDSRFVSAYWLSKLQAVVCRRRKEAECISLVTGSWGPDWFNCLLLYLHIQLVDSVVLFGGSQAASTLHALQWQQSYPSLSLQGLNRACACTDHIIVAGSGWFKSILDLLYFSLPRPPEILQFTWFSSSRCKFLTS